MFFLCSHCDRGHRYCSDVCSSRARREQRRRSNQRHQRSPEGRLDHRDRQRQYRARRSRVTDHSSFSTPSPASLAWGSAPARPPLLQCRIADAADFFDLLSVTERVRHGAAAECEMTAGELRRAIEGQPRNGDIRLLHNLDRSISEQVIDLSNELGGATRLLAAAPFWDKGSAIDRLCKALGVDCVFIHAHEFGTVEGTAGANWPAACSTAVHPVRFEIMNDPRRLHAKAFEVMCRRGRVLVSGSANATGAALGDRRQLELPANDN